MDESAKSTLLTIDKYDGSDDPTIYVLNYDVVLFLHNVSYEIKCKDFP